MRLARTLRSRGYDVQNIDASPQMQFHRAAEPGLERRSRQTADTVHALQRKYEAPVFGEITMWDAVNMLGHVIDHFDRFLMNVSQEVHTLQVAEGMVAEGADETMVLVGVIHDVGKVLYLADEDPANISGTTAPIGEHEPGIGLDRCLMQWGSDDFSYSRIIGRVPDHVAWLVRYHSIVPDSCEHLMDDRDREYYEKYWPQLHRLDHVTKSTYQLPRTRLSDYRALIDDAFPDPIPF